MDLDKVPEELQELTEIEKMLITRVFLVMSIYRFCGEQHEYHRNVINFSQNVKELAIHLPRDSSLLDMLVIYRQSANNLRTFRDFQVCRDKIARALYWLKEYNHYYSNIIIDHKILQSLPTNGSIDDQFQHTKIIAEDLNEDEDNVITHIFVPLPLSTQCKDVGIKNTLDCMQNKERLIE
jgi:hypothetical protein